MNNFIRCTLEIEEERVFIERYIEDKLNNRLTVYLSNKKTMCTCERCGSAHCVVHDYRETVFSHNQYPDNDCPIIYRKRRYKCMDCEKIFPEPNYLSNGTNQISDLTVRNLYRKKRFTNIWDSI